MTLTELYASLSAFRFPCGTELELQDAVAAALDNCNVAYQRELRLSPHDRIDFLAGGVGIECKISDGPAKLLAQLVSYASDPRIEALLLVTSRSSHRGMPATIHGKPVAVLWITGTF